MDLVGTILDGILLGGLYALFAAGLSLIFGVMRLVNIAHGDLIILSAFIALIVAGGLGLHPLV
jgi:branched-chain amino acid transport system permease protein